MNTRVFNSIAVLSSILLCSCAANVPVFEPPTSGATSNITFVNNAKTQRASFDTFQDGTTCMGRRRIQFGNDTRIPAGGSGYATVAAGREFALFASLDKIESDELSVDIGMTGGGPAPVKTRTVLAIGCSVEVSFTPGPGKSYEVAMSDATSPGLCSLDVFEIDGNGNRGRVATDDRIPISPPDVTGPFCAAL